MHDPLRRARVHQTVRQSLRQAQPALDFAQCQQATFRRQPAAVKASNHRLALNRRQTRKKRRKAPAIAKPSS
jgi:hypothetical protein